MTTQVSEQVTTQPPGYRLKHTCAVHPRLSDGPHGPECVSFCGLRPGKTPTGRGGPIVRNGSSCVVCDAMFDARFR